MPIPDGYKRNTAQYTIVRILTVDRSNTCVEGVLRDGGKIMIPVRQSSAAFRWPRVDEVWYVKREGVDWGLVGRLLNQSDKPLTDVTDDEVRLDANRVTKADGTELITAADVGNIVASDKSFVYEQVASASTWVISHPLDKFPSIIIVDSAGSVVNGDITYNSTSQITVTFSSPFGGKAYLN